MFPKIMKTLLIKFFTIIIPRIWYCTIWKSHTWTTPVSEGKEPNLKNIHMEKDLMFSIYEHSKKTCKNCGVEAEPSKRFLTQIKSKYAEVRD